MAIYVAVWAVPAVLAAVEVFVAQQMWDKPITVTYDINPAASELFVPHLIL